MAFGIKLRSLALFLLLSFTVFVSSPFFKVAFRSSGYYGTGARKRTLPSEARPIPPAPSPASPLFVLILSSTPRSGSTFLSELLNSVKDSVLFFEPLWMQQNTDCIQESDCVQGFLMEAFACNYTRKFEQWLKQKTLFFSYFNQVAASCLKKTNANRTSCIKKFDLRKACLDSPVRIMKVIRARLQWFKGIIRDPTINLKIIHLTRDPRGSLHSISQFKNWNKRPYDHCHALSEDMNVYDIFADRYPSRVLHVSYEKLCLQTKKETERIFEFLYGIPSLPMEVVNYIDTHTKENGGDEVMSTHKHSTEEFQAWRWHIAVSNLKSFEMEPTCLVAIRRMRHTVFESLAWVRNASIPLLLP